MATSSIGRPVRLNKKQWEHLQKIMRNPPAPTDTQLYMKDKFEVGHPYYLSVPAHKMWKKLSAWIDKCWYALFDPNHVEEFFYSVLKAYFPDEVEIKDKAMDESYSFKYFEYHPEKIDHTPTNELFPALLEELDFIIKDGKYAGVRVSTFESCFISEFVDRYYF